MLRHPPKSTLFPSPTLFRSDRRLRQAAQELEHRRVLVHAAEELRAIDPAARPLGDPRVADRALAELGADLLEDPDRLLGEKPEDRKSTRLNSSHSQISYAVF